MTVRLAFVVASQFAKAEYLDAIASYGVEVSAVETVSGLYDLLSDEEVNGLLLDVPSVVRASGEEKAFIHDLIQIFPSARLRWDPQASMVKTLFYGESPASESSFESFVGRCDGFSARTIRMSDRVGIHFNVLVSPEPVFSEVNAARTVTMNASAGGCFLYSAEGGERLQTFWIRIMELSDPAPIAVEVRWRSEWGRSLSIPGAGVKFKEIAKGQIEEISRFCSRHRFEVK